ncbi:uncharacterized protein [Littorina saxatilis]|uniref:uncharacterized protein isoform X2 n=1 Tax=Littorina saxatilis TaxID=31220 RepID=UPI0038B5BAC6
MTTTTATLRMLLLICISLGQIRLVTMQSVTVPVHGVYLITMVADPRGRSYMILQFNGHDAGFVAYGVEDAIAGLVVAVYLKGGTRVSARYQGNTQAATSLGVAFASYNERLKVTYKYGNRLQGGTTFSFVYLEGNQQKYIKHTNHIAFTAWTDRLGQSWHEKLSFNKARPTDYGSLYNSAERVWTIPTAGTYIVSMRGHPDGNTLKVIFYKSYHKYLFAWFNENRTIGGQAGVFQFTKGDRLYMVNEYGRYVGKETFMSIALLWVASE